MTSATVASPEATAPSVHTVRVEPAGWTFAAGAGETLLAAGLRAGIELPTSCRNGTCRACLCRLRAGMVAYRIDWPGISAEERAEGWTLPCVAVCRSDVVIEQPRAAPLPADTP